jgi:ribosomal-protein-alanine N-acetyltransferase
VKVETERLLLIPLNYDQLIKYLMDDSSLEDELDLNETNRTISEELKEVFRQTILPNVADIRKNYLYSTIWAAVLKEENKMIGDLCFTGEPNSAGEIEIGYGTYEAFRNRGYMTEAVGGMIAWARKQAGINAITAGTEKKNLASFKVLRKNNFKKHAETELLYKWKVDLNVLAILSGELSEAQLSR